MTRLIVVRHGNTFAPGEIPRRVGGRTDLDLVESGIEQAKRLGQHFKEKGIIPDLVVTSTLKRTIQTADYILKDMKSDLKIQPDNIFDEVDYGPDENKQEADVIDRIGLDAIKLWDTKGIVPQGWDFNPEKTKQDWRNFASYIVQNHTNKTVIVVTSNGIARFAPVITDAYYAFQADHTIKLKTGSYGVLEYAPPKWILSTWGQRPEMA